jgi:hypothetical protein
MLLTLQQDLLSKMLSIFILGRSDSEAYLLIAAVAPAVLGRLVLSMRRELIFEEMVAGSK